MGTARSPAKTEDPVPHQRSSRGLRGVFPRAGGGPIVCPLRTLPAQVLSRSDQRVHVHDRPHDISLPARRSSKRNLLIGLRGGSTIEVPFLFSACLVKRLSLGCSDHRKRRRDACPCAIERWRNILAPYCKVSQLMPFGRTCPVACPVACASSCG